MTPMWHWFQKSAKLPRRCGMMCLVWLALLCSAADLAAQTLGDLEEEAFKAAVSRVAPSVVRIETFGGLEKVGELVAGTGPTTGLVVSGEGHILSSAFSFARRPTSILVTTHDGQRLPAELVARDHSRMLVLLKVSPESPLAVPTFAPADKVRVGQWSIALGRTYAVEHPNVSVGIVSATGRIWSKAIQTDAKISPNNYGGPLVDIRGHVLGILVPLSPSTPTQTANRAAAALAGAEWYDSGIGFAIPLQRFLTHLPRLSAGEDLQPGLLGINLKGNNPYGDKPVVGVCPAKSPAYLAGLRVGDEIRQVDDMPIRRPAELRHALGPRYAGETVSVVAFRGDKRLEMRIKLVDAIPPYVQPSMGILPMRTASRDGVKVRAVLTDGPAAAAGIRQGDTIEAIAGTPVATADELREQLAGLEPGSSLEVSLRRGDETEAIELTLGPMANDAPKTLPAHPRPEQLADVTPTKTGARVLKLADEPTQCQIFIPDTYHPDIPHGLVVWLHAPGADKRAELIKQWETHCRQRNLIFLAPKALDARGWQPGEVAIIRKLIDKAMEDYSIDGQRVVLHGQAGGGALAYIVAFRNRDVVRAVVPVDAALPAPAAGIHSDPQQPLAIYSIVPPQSRLKSRIAAGVEALQERKIPASAVNIDDQGGQLSATERQQLIRWIDSLDRL